MVSLSKISVNGQTTSVNSNYAGNFQGLLNDLKAQGYEVNSLGGYNYRNIAGTNKLSKHALGNAIDVNPSANPVTYGGSGNMITDIPNGQALADKWGLGWGGGWKGSKRDPMHFEVVNSTTPMNADGANAPLAGYVDPDNPQQIVAGGTPETSPAGTLSWANTKEELAVADANGDGDVTVQELKEYNSNVTAANAAGGASAGQQGIATSIPKAIVTAANQQSQATASAAKTLAAGATADTMATNASNQGIVSGFTSWLGGRVLQIMVFILAAIFILIGLYFFAPKMSDAIPA